MKGEAAMRLEWDEEKNALNLKQHRIEFETAAFVFENPHAVTLRDTARDEAE